MSKNLNVSLAFTANTNEAIAQIKRLQKELNGLATGQNLKNSGITQITPEIQKAMVAAGELQAKLESAVNLKTGKLDLSQFSASLKKGQKSLSDYAKELSALGPEGRAAFTNLAQSIVQAEAPLIRCNSKLKELGTTLANTARWQLSSSILHGFMGAISSAYGYAQDLNESLNNIRIVTGQSVDQMAKFSAEANKAARALSTTTTEYTKASLIYYQQGLSDQQVKERTDITIKMANVARQSAEVVSDQMTAVWNNFYDGSKSLEHYADVMTALGAATASSSDEIAGGLEKFSAVAQTIGLSYEYAASALATITAISRESEDVVGTALKTIFARIQGLKLGETLDDGTSLNKYSEALSKVGISIFDQAGELKNMDSILNEMGAKWDTLNAAQKQALAQTVAGVRQYNQLMTLMNNWDSFQTNLGIANSSSGALQNQANIYAESWEAARDRVTASAEAVYDKLLDDEFFIDFLDGISKAIDGISHLIDALGGVQGVLFTIGNVVTRIFQKELAQGARNAVYTLKQLTPLGKKEQAAQKAEAITALQQMRSESGGKTGRAENEAYNHEWSMQERLISAAERLSDEDVKQLQTQMDLVRTMDQRAIAAAQLADTAEKELKTLQQQQKLQARMDAEAEASQTGRLHAGQKLLQNKGKIAGFGDAQQRAIADATSQAEATVRARHNFTAEQALGSDYQQEVAAAMMDALSSMQLDEEIRQPIQEFINREINEVRTSLRESVQSAERDIENYQEQIQNAGKLNAQGTALSRTSSSLQGKINAGVLSLDNAQDLNYVYDLLYERLTKSQEASTKLAQTLTNPDAQKEVSDLAKKFDGFIEKLKAAKGNAEGLQEILDKLNTDEEAENIALMAQSSAKMSNQAIELDAKTNSPRFNAAGQFEKADEEELRSIVATTMRQDSNTALKGFQDSFNKKIIIDWADGIASAADVVMGFGSVITSVQGMLDVFNNPDATGWQKFTAVITTLSTAMMTAKSIFEGFKTLQQAEIPVRIMNEAVTRAQAKAQKELNKERKQEAGSKENIEINKKDTQKKAKGTKEKVTWDSIWNGSKQAQSDRDDALWDALSDEEKDVYRKQVGGVKTDQEYFEEVYAEKGYHKKNGHWYKKNANGTNQRNPNWNPKTGNKKAEHIWDAEFAADEEAMKKEAASRRDAAQSAKDIDAKKLAGKQAGGTGLKGALSSTAAGFAAAAALVAVAAISYKALDDAYNKNALNAQKTAESAQMLGQSYEDVKNKFNELKTTISNYDSAKDSLKELTRGTVEFSEAVTTANDNALKLLDTYGETIKGRYTVDADGVIQIDEAAMEDVKKAQMGKVAKAQAASIATNRDARDAKVTADITDFNRNTVKSQEGFMSTGDDWNTVGKGAAIGLGAGAATAATAAALGATIGSVVPIVGTLIGAGIGALVGAGIGMIVAANTETAETEQEKDAIADLAKEYNEKGSSALTAENMKSFLQEKGYSEDLINSLIENKDEVAKLCQAMDANTKATQAENEAMAAQALANVDDVQNAANKEQIIEIAAKDLDKKANDIESEMIKNGWGTDGIAQIDGANAQAQKIFKEYAEAAGLDVNKVKLTDTTGNDDNRKFVYTDESGKEQTIALEAMRSVVATAKANENMAANVDVLVQALAGRSTAEANLMSAVVTKDASQLTMGQLTNGTASAKAIAGTLSAEQLTAMGFTGTLEEMQAAYVTAFEGVAQKGIDSFNAMAATFPDSVETSMKSLRESGVMDSLTHAQAQAFGNTLEQAFAYGGEQGVNTMSQMFAKANKEGYGDEFITSMNSIDWDNIDAEGLSEQLKAAGINTTYTIGQLESMIKVMSSGKKTITDASATYKNLHSVIDNLKDGGIITKEQFDALGSGMDKYFRQMADGTYQLIADAEEFYKVINKKSIQGFKDNIQIYKDKNAQINNVVDKYGVGKESLLTNASWARDSSGRSQRINTNTAEAQLEFLEASGYADSEQLALWKQILEGYNGGTGTEEQNLAMGEIYKAVQNQWGFWETYEATYQNNLKAIAVEQEKLLSSAKTLSDLELYVGTAVEEGSMSYNTYAESLKGLSYQYENTTAERKAYDEALMSGNQTEIKAAESALKLAIQTGEVAAKYGLSTQELELQAQMIQQQYTDAEGKSSLSYENALKMAEQNQRMNQGLGELISNWDRWKTVLDSSDTTSQEYAQTLSQLSGVVKKLTGASDDWEVSAEFMLDNMDLIEKAATQDEKAIARLGVALAKANFEKVMAKVPSLSSLSKAFKKESDAFEQEYVATGGRMDTLGKPIRGKGGLQMQAMDDPVNHDEAKLEALTNAWENAKKIVTDGMDIMDKAIADGTLKVGMSLTDLESIDPNFDANSWITSMNQMAEATGMSVAEMQSYLDSMGMDATIDTKVVETKKWVTGYSIKPDGEGGYNVVPGDPVEVKDKMEVATINGDVKYVGNGNANPPKSGSGGSPQKLERTKKSGLIDRYKEINDQLDSVKRRMEKVNREADTLWGAARIKKMQEATALMKQENKLLQQKAQLAKDYLENGSESDKNDLIDIINKNVKGTTFKAEDLFDEEGKFVGYHEVTDKLYAQIKAAEDKVKNPENMTDAEKKAIEDAKKQLQDVLDAQKLYDETRQTALDAINDYEQGLINIQQANLDELTAKMELEIEVNESDLARLDYYLSKIDDDIYGKQERLIAMIGQVNEATGELINGNLNDTQLNNYLENLTTYQDKYNELVRKYTTIDAETGQTYINQSQFMEQVKALQGELYGELGNVKALDDMMKTYYGDTVAAAQEELSNYTSKMEHHNSVLEHYSTLMDLLGQGKNFTVLIKLAEGQAKIAENTAKVSKETYETMQSQADDWAKKMEEYNIDPYATADTLTEEQRMIRDNWEAAVAAAQEAQDQMLSDAAAWAEALKALLEQQLAGLADILNKNLAGEFGSLDQMNLAMERKNSLQEEYLTTTNQIYETDKMIRTAQQEIDKTSNTAAKRRLKQFIEETAELQNQNKLSEHELKIQQAKYDLTLAEIALEEAQNAKSTVRLQRDAEGNFGYVYTADQSKVADAEQKLADAQNSLYNIGLEGANNYAQKYADTISEMNDEITALTEAWMNGDITSEDEYRKQKDALVAHYYAKLQDYSKLYNVSLQTDMRVEADAWSTQFGGMTADTEKWMSYVKEYAGEAIAAFGAYNTEIDKITGYTIGEDATIAAEKTQEIVDANKEIADAITGEGGVLEAMDKQMDGISDIILSYINMRDAIMEAVEAAEDLANATNAATHQGSTSSGDEEQEDNTEPKLYGRIGIKSGVQLYNNKSGELAVGDAPAEATIGNILPGSHGYYVIGDDGKTGWIKRDDIDSFDTGGYTGTWGPYGKMAMLHEKELILNKNDTANLLTSMEVLERILQILDLQAFSVQAGGFLSSPGFRETGNQTIDQHIEIKAEFPNATDRFEIEEAFKSMANLASQYANKK